MKNPAEAAVGRTTGLPKTGWTPLLHFLHEVLEVLRDGELHDRLRGDLDRLSRRRVAAHAGLPLHDLEFPQTREGHFPPLLDGLLDERRQGLEKDLGLLLLASRR